MKKGYEPKDLLGEMGQICEEAGEVLMHFGKILRFGIDNVWLDKNRSVKHAESNRQAFYRELDDLEACIKRIKARHKANPTEPLQIEKAPSGLGSRYLDLAVAAQKYLELGPGEHEMPGDGVTQRGKRREAERQLNALVGAALACKCRYDFVHDKNCPFWPNGR